MERKSIGAFIAALRKASGMTQKELADKLNISDKSVSRWEREESAPDLTLIPILADIFGVTSDELLRGERRHNNVDSAASEFSGKDGGVGADKGGRTERQLKALLDRTRSRFRERSLISAGIGVAGIFAAMIANFGFLRAYIGFFTACVFYAAALICETVFVLRALGSIEGGDFDSDSVNTCRAGILRDAKFSAAVTVCLFFATLPLIYLPGDTYAGLSTGAWLMHGLVCAAAGVVLCLIASEVITGIMLRRGYLELPEAQLRVREKNQRLKKKTATAVLAAVAALAAAQTVFNLVVSPQKLADGKTFDNFEDFREYIETSADAWSGGGRNEVSVEIGVVIGSGEPDYGPDDKGEYYREYIYDADGNAIFSFRHLNRLVTYMETSPSGLPIVTYTEPELYYAGMTIDMINTAFVILYFVSAVSGTVFYLVKRKRIAG